VFAGLLREHNADHGAEEGPGEAAPAADAPPTYLRSDTAAINARAAAEAVGAGGRSAGEAPVQQARLAAAPTFARKDGEEEEEDGDAAQLDSDGKEGSGKYGRQLARFETMIQQTRSGEVDDKAGSKVWRAAIVVAGSAAWRPAGCCHWL
jgi:hypothetical protein